MAASASSDSVMEADDDHRWRHRYAATARLLPQWARTARPTLLGFSACVDACVRLESLDALLSPDAPPAAGILADALLSRVRGGIGGEVMLDWPEGDRWLAASFGHKIGVGGASAQIASALAILDAPALLALGDRGPEQLSALAGGIGVADAGRLRRVSEVAPLAGSHKPRHWIFETMAGTRIGSASVARSTRVIVRVADDLPQDDPDFDALSVALAPRCGAAALSSLVATPHSRLAEVLSRVSAVARRWRDAGLGLVHLEMADYGRKTHFPAGILAALRGIVTSVGMSGSEWRMIGGGRPGNPAELLDFACHHGLDRLCVHTDGCAMSVTRGDPSREAAALLSGCLLASARAASGRLDIPCGLPADAVIGEAPPSGSIGDGWSTVSCPAPYLRHPKSTIGLGDTFCAGSLLVLGQPATTDVTID